MVKVHVIWGESPEHGEGVTSYEFASEQEADAFVRGANEAMGWGDASFVADPSWVYDANVGEPVPPHKLSSAEN